MRVVLRHAQSIAMVWGEMIEFQTYLETWIKPDDKTMRRHLIEDHGVDERLLAKQNWVALRFAHDAIHYALRFENEPE